MIEWLLASQPTAGRRRWPLRCRSRRFEDAVDAPVLVPAACIGDSMKTCSSRSPGSVRALRPVYRAQAGRGHRDPSSVGSIHFGVGAIPNLAPTSRRRATRRVRRRIDLAAQPRPHARRLVIPTRRTGDEHRRRDRRRPGGPGQLRRLHEPAHARAWPSLRRCGPTLSPARIRRHPPPSGDVRPRTRDRHRLRAQPSRC